MKIMKLIKHYTTKDKKYFKYEVVIPNDKVKEAGLNEKDELRIDIKNKVFLLLGSLFFRSYP